MSELIAMRNLNHPHVVRGLAAGECVLHKISLLYLVMDVADGTLEQHLERRLPSAADAKEIVQSIAKGLIFLHGKNMVHRDLKPGNVLCINGEWQLADFGLIRTFGNDSGTFTQTVAGTPVFMPPESFKGEVSPAWNVWSLGVLIVYAFTKQYPFTGASHHEIASAIMAQEPRIASPLPKPFDAIVRGCLIKDRRSRWTAQQVLLTLQETATVSTVKSGNGSGAGSLPKVSGSIDASWKDASVKLFVAYDVKLTYGDDDYVTYSGKSPVDYKAFNGKLHDPERQLEAELRRRERMRQQCKERSAIEGRQALPALLVSMLGGITGSFVAHRIAWGTYSFAHFIPPKPPPGVASEGVNVFPEVIGFCLGMLALICAFGLWRFANWNKEEQKKYQDKAT